MESIQFFQDCLTSTELVVAHILVVLSHFPQGNKISVVRVLCVEEIDHNIDAVLSLYLGQPRDEVLGNDCPFLVGNRKWL